VILLVLGWPLRAGTQNAAAQPNIDINEVDLSHGDAEIYAKNHGVSVEEALDRFHLQEVAGELDARLAENEAETFAGLWVEHSPAFHIVVLFTQDAEQKIKPYITAEIADLLEVRIAERSLAELEKTQQELLSALIELTMPLETEIDVYENNIKLYIAEADKLRFDNALQSGALTVPEYVEVTVIPELGQPE
jgi:hypothetical protein